MRKLLLFALSLSLLSATGFAGTQKHKHPFVSDQVAREFSERSFNRVPIHHEENLCGANDQSFEILVTLPFPKPPLKRMIAVHGPDCANERRMMIEAELARMSFSAFKTVRKRTSFRFFITFRVQPE